MSEHTMTPAEREVPSGPEEDITPPLPRTRDLHRALRIYVAGRTRFWTADEKRAAADERQPTGEPEVSELVAPDDRPGSRVPVPVPETLQFHRAVGTWRDEIPGGRRRPSGSRID